MDKDTRCCKCGKHMWEGFKVYDNWYCDEECLHKDYSEKEYEKLYEEENKGWEQGSDEWWSMSEPEVYWTSWIDEMEEE